MAYSFSTISILGFLLSIHLCLPLYAQISYEHHYRTPADFNIVAIREEFQHKKFGEGIGDSLKGVCWAALSHYPELKNTHISFLLVPNGMIRKPSMRAQPRTDFLFYRQNRRHYLVKMNPESDVLNTLSFNTQLGWMGHELAHIQYYDSLSNWKMLGLAIRYLSTRWRCKYERETDRITIKHGLGYALYEGTHHIFTAPHIHPDRVARYKKKYLSPQEIIEEIKMWEQR